VIERIRRYVDARRAAGVLLILMLLALRYWDPRPIEELRLRAFDFYQVLHPRPVTARPVVIVDIDEKSLATYGQWPWPRPLIADLVARLQDMQSVVIGFDVVFPEPDRSSPDQAVKNFRGIDEQTRERLLELPSGDEVFAAAIGQGRVVLGQSGLPSSSAQQFDASALPQTGFAVLGPDPSAFLMAYPGHLRNLPVLEKAAAGRGLFTANPEPDGIMRRVPLVMRAAGDMVPALSLEMLRVATQYPSILVRADDAGINSVAVPGLELPTDENGRVWMYFNKHDPARYVPVKDVLEGNVPPDRFAGRLVLIGTSAVGLLDVKTTPLDRVFPGVEIHAQLLEAALTGTMLLTPNYSIAIELALALFFGAIIIVLAPMVSALPLLLTSVFAALTTLAGSWVMFQWFAQLLDATFPVLSIGSLYLSLALIGYFREQADRRRIRTAFGQYLSPHLVEQLAKSRDKLKLGGEERQMTVLFSDVRGFTTIAEMYRNEPDGLTRLMNRFLTPVSDAILERQGTIDKYMGDAVMAFWNAPLNDDQHELHAAAASLEVLSRVRQLNEQRKQEASAEGKEFVPIKMGIGVNTGRCIVGNMGSDQRFQYTVMGDTVNLASRLEGQTKAYGIATLIGSATAARIADQFAVVEVDWIRVKGKAEAERVFTIVGDDMVARSPDFQAARQTFATVLELYRKRDWPAALQMIDSSADALKTFGLGDLLALYQTRVRDFMQTPPPPDWDGVYVAETK
jgi:adenylate cyclase